MQSEQGLIYSSRALETDTGATRGQKQAKNGPKRPKSMFSSDRSLLFRIFSPISLNEVRTRSNILIESFGNWYRGHNRPKTGQKCPKMAKIDFWAAAPKGTKPCRTQGESVRPSVRPSSRLSVHPPHPILRALSPLGPFLTQILPNSPNPSNMAQI